MMARPHQRLSKKPGTVTPQKKGGWTVIHDSHPPLDLLPPGGEDEAQVLEVGCCQ